MQAFQLSACVALSGKTAMRPQILVKLPHMHLVWVRASVLGLLNFEEWALTSLKTVKIGYVAQSVLSRCLDRFPRPENVAKQISSFELIHKVVELQQLADYFDSQCPSH
jgi:hypothetical protein